MEIQNVFHFNSTRSEFSSPLVNPPRIEGVASPVRGLQILAPPNLVQITHLSTHLGGQPSCLPWQNANGEGKAKAGVLLITAPGVNSSRSFYFSFSSHHRHLHHHLHHALPSSSSSSSSSFNSSLLPPLSSSIMASSSPSSSLCRGPYHHHLRLC